jgi:Xaa-Pro aminopeptidase
MHRLRLTLALALCATPLTAQIPQAEYAQRRAALAAKLQDGVLLALGSPEPAQDYLSFFQNESFTYLTGYNEANAALVMVKRGGQTTATLFVESRDPAAEVWTGRRFGPEGAKKFTGIDTRPVQELRPVLDSLLGTATSATCEWVAHPATVACSPPTISSCEHSRHRGRR